MRCQFRSQSDNDRKPKKSTLDLRTRDSRDSMFFTHNSGESPVNFGVRDSNTTPGI